LSRLLAPKTHHRDELAAVLVVSEHLPGKLDRCSPALVAASPYVEQ